MFGFAIDSTFYKGITAVDRDNHMVRVVNRHSVLIDLLSDPLGRDLIRGGNGLDLDRRGMGNKNDRRSRIDGNRDSLDRRRYNSGRLRHHCYRRNRLQRRSARDGTVIARRWEFDLQVVFHRNHAGSPTRQVIDTVPVRFGIYFSFQGDNAVVHLDVHVTIRYRGMQRPFYSLVSLMRFRSTRKNEAGSGKRNKWNNEFHTTDPFSYLTLKSIDRDHSAVG